MRLKLVIANFKRIIDQFFGLHDIKDCNSGSTGKVISTKSGSQHAEPWFKFRTDQYSTNRESISHSFGYRNNIRFYISILMCEKHSAPSVSRLNFVKNQNRFIPVSYTHLRAHETRHDLVCRLLLEKKKKKKKKKYI